jgi:hypothetical protein
LRRQRKDEAILWWVWTEERKDEVYYSVQILSPFLTAFCVLL